MPTTLDQVERLSLSEVSEYSTNTPDLLSPTTSTNQTTEDARPIKSPEESRQSMMERLRKLQTVSYTGQQPAPELSFCPPEEQEGHNDSENSLCSSQGQSGTHCVGVSSGMEWVVKRMYAICSEVASIYVQVTHSFTSCASSNIHIERQFFSYKTQPKEEFIFVQITLFRCTWTNKGTWIWSVSPLNLTFSSSQTRLTCKSIKSPLCSGRWLGLILVLLANHLKPECGLTDFSKEFTFGEIGAINEEEEPLEIRAPNTRESMEWGAGPMGLETAPSASGDFYQDSTKMYTVATNKTIKNMMKEYKRRKVQHSRSMFVRKPLQEMKDPVFDPSKSADDNYQTVSFPSPSHPTCYFCLS